MKLLLDRHSLQVFAHYGNHPAFRAVEGQRLQGFLECAAEAGTTNISVSDGGPDQFSSVSDVDVIAILTRLQDAPFTKRELAELHSFLRQGGAVLLMSNHPAFDENDGVFAKTLGVEIRDWFRPKSGRQRWTIAVERVDDEFNEGMNEGLVFNNSTRLYVKDERARVAVHLPAESEENGVFAAFREDQETGSRVFVCADSGFIGNCDTRRPGPGQMCKGDNRRFMYSVFRWLSRAGR